MRGYCKSYCGCRPGTAGSRLLTTLGGGEVAEFKWWDPNDEGLCIWAAYQPKGAADLASSYLDLSGNGNNTGPGVAPTWDAVNGWKFNGVNQYLSSAFTSQADQSQSIIVQFTNLADAVGADQWLVGQRQGAFYFGLREDTAAANRVLYANGGLLVAAPKLLAGNLGVAGNQGYRNGVADGGAIAAAGAGANPLAIGAQWNVGIPGPTLYAQVYIQALAIYDCTLTAPQVLAVATAMAAL